MLQFLESPTVVWFIILSFFLLFFILYLTILPKNSRRQRSTGTSQVTVEENRSECTMLGFLEKLPRGDPIPTECMNCRKLVECAMAKRAFDWYLGQNSPQT